MPQTTAKNESGARKVYKDHNLHVVFAVTLMAVLGTSSVTPAFPEIVQELGISSGQVGLLITVFTLPGVLLTSVWGALSDRFGRRKILVPSLMLFGIGGGACAFVRDFELLLVLRALQGTGAAALGAINVFQCWLQRTKHSELRFRALLCDASQDTPLKWVTIAADSSHL